MRYKPEIKWSDKSWTHNVFRAFEYIFGRKYGIRRESSVFVNTETLEVKREFYTLEARIAYFETKVRELFKPMLLRNPQLNYQRGAIAFDNTGETLNDATSPASFAYTCTGSDLVMMMRTGSVSDTDTAFTYNSVSLTLIDKTTYLGAGRQGVNLYYLINPATGSNTVSVSFSSGAKWVWVSSYTGAKQSGQPDSSAKASDPGASATTNLTTTVVATGCWLVGGCSTDQGDEAAGTGTTKRGTAQNGSIYVDSNGTVGTGSQSLQVTHTSTATRAYVVASIAPSTGTALVGFMGLLGVGK